MSFIAKLRSLSRTTLLSHSLHSSVGFHNIKNIRNFSSSKPDLLKVEASCRDANVLLSIVPPNELDTVKRAPTTVVCVIDVSGSMGTQALINTGKSTNESYGLTSLDLVKHSLKTIIKSLTKDDKLSLVSFSTKARVVLELTDMDDKGRDIAIEALNELRLETSTNLWDGLQRGMEVLKKRKSDDIQHNTAILLLTDGVPNIIPPRGHMPMLQKYQKEVGGELPGIINTFGFGYSLDSALLNDIAVFGRGAYSFIPDGSMVGTIFVNSMSNLLSNVAVNVELELDLNNIKLNKSDLLKRFQAEASTKSLKLKLGSVGFGQNKSLILPISFLDTKILQGKLTYKSPFQETAIIPFECKIDNQNDEQALISRFRIETANSLLDAVEYLQKNPKKDSFKAQVESVQDIVKTIESSPVKDDKYLNDLMIDLKEQVSIAFSKKEFYQKWGQHYLPSLARAHLLQQCNNFKDPGVQHFGGEIFKANRDKLDEMFLTLSPPVPSGRSQGGGGAGLSLVNMQVFHNSSNVCFDGSCSALMIDGSYKLVRDIKQGDKIYSSKGNPAIIKCVIKTKIQSKKTELVCLEGGLRITPWHPVKINNIFVFPISMGYANIMDCEAVYNFVLEDQHIMNINGIECVTLGHGLEDNDVVKHEYFGTDRVIKDLEKFSGWKNGLVELRSEWVLRDKKIGHINKIDISLWTKEENNISVFA